jgi:hypothetical protein
MEWKLLTHWKVQIEIVGRTWTLDEHGDFQKEWFVQNMNMTIVIEPWRSSSGSIKATNMQTQESKQPPVPFTKEGGGERET